ncbi:hypothetical protein CBR_g46811 [Chara braunii]|uniref:Uncharacterized protein n=1 Tax=Chara braunii TaxID=69332 RepID=A0A388M0Z2_CHABU|nr:hypothetical protein CBR_g46811 [Chara braunii]|eukprot:GBG88244.1 hypothetical protein CBR_g46811 [Chara braunii]
MADVFRRLPLLLLVVLLLHLLVVFHVCILGNVPRRRSKRRSLMKDTRTEARQAIARSRGEQVGGRRCGGRPSTVGRASQRVGYEALPLHLQPLPGSSDEEEEERRPHTVSFGSGSTQEWAATELCGTGGGVYEQSFTELLRPGLSGDEGDGRVNLSFGLSTGRSSTPSRTVLVHPHPDDDGGQLTAVDRSSKTRVLARDTTGANLNSSTQQAWAPSLSRAAQARPHWMQSPSPLSAASEVARRHGREVWKEHRRELRAWQEESITRGLERLRVGDREKETSDPPAEADDDDKDDIDGEGGEGGGGYVSSCLQSDMVRKGGKSKPFGRTGRPRAKKGQGKGSGGDGDGDGARVRPDETVGMKMARRRSKIEERGRGQGCREMREEVGQSDAAVQESPSFSIVVRGGWDNLMQQFKKVHHFQSSSGGADFFQLSAKERASRGFNFTMDRAVYDEIEGSTGINHTIHPKNVAGTGASAGVRLPSTSNADPESVADGDGGGARRRRRGVDARFFPDDGYPRWFWEEEEHEAADFRRADGMLGEAQGANGVDDGECKQAAMLHPGPAVRGVGS